MKYLMAIILSLGASFLAQAQDPDLYPERARGDRKASGEESSRADSVDMNPEQFLSFIRSEAQKWGDIARRVGAKAE